MSGPLPDFVIIGAPKAGTTSMARWLGAHPDGFVPTAKELRFLDRQWERGLDVYRERLAPPDDAAVVGEATPTYLAHPDAPARAAAVLGGTRFVAILRDPVERLWSHFWFVHRERRRGRRVPDIEALLQDEEQRGVPPDGLLTHGLYAHHLDRWATRVGHDAILAVTFDALQDDPVGTFATVCRFVGLDPDAVPDEVGRAHNVSHRLRVPRLRRWMLRHRVWRRAPRLGMRLDRWNQAEATNPPLDPALRRRLARWYADDTGRLDRWLTRVPDRWSTA